jgi:hypothetical protein
MTSPRCNAARIPSHVFTWLVGLPFNYGIKRSRLKLRSNQLESRGYSTDLQSAVYFPTQSFTAAHPTLRPGGSILGPFIGSFI